MSKFEVRVAQITNVEPHPNADRLELALINDFQGYFVTGLGQFEIGDNVVFFPDEAVLPDELIDEVEIPRTFLQKGSVVKVSKVRGIPSNGLLIEAQRISRYLDVTRLELGQDVAEILGVKKRYFDAVNTNQQDVKMYPLSMVEKYDLEHVANYHNVMMRHKLSRFVITEKLEGTNFAVTYKNGEIFYHQRNFTVVPQTDDVHYLFVKAPRVLGVEERLVDLAKSIGLNDVTLRGELIGPGIQKNHYELDSLTYGLFDIMVGQKYVDYPVFYNMCENHDLRTAPLLDDHYQIPSEISPTYWDELSFGYSKLNESVLREGIVIRPYVESWDLELGRVIFKVRNSEYLAKTGAS